MTEPQFFYRYEDVQYAAPVDEFDNPMGRGELRVELRKYRVVKATPTGVWLALYLGHKRFVRLNARKRFACPTVAEAAESFRARKERQRAIHEARAERAERAMELLDRLP